MKPENYISGNGFYLSNSEIFIGSDAENFFYFNLKVFSGLIVSVEEVFILEER